MFEQSILASANPRARLGPLAASLTAQCTAATVLVLLPLVYTDRLAAVLHDPPLPPLLLERPKPPERVVQATEGQRSGTTRTYMVKRFQHAESTSWRERSAVDLALLDLTPPSDYTGPLAPPSGFERNAATRGGITDVPAPPPAEAKPAPAAPVRVSEGVQAAKLLRRVLPEYPQIAKIARVQGVVQLVAVISRDGTIQELRVVSGHHMLVPAAVAAVRQWVYRPTLLSGQPVEVIAPIEVRFQLAQ